MQRGLAWVRSFLKDGGAGAANRELSRLSRFAHFCLLVGRSFSKNRCPVRAAALAYTSLLALIPMLAVVLSVSTTFLKKDGEERISSLIDKLVASVTPPAVPGTNADSDLTAGSDETAPNGVQTNGAAAITTATPTLPAVKTIQTGQDERYVTARKQVTDTINGFIRNTRSKTIGVTGTVLLFFVAISMLSRVEETFNDIWGVERGRGWFRRIVQYWAVITLGPVLLVVALGLASGPHLASTRRLLAAMPMAGEMLFIVLPVVVLCVAFALLYMLMPNTKVHWQAAAVGGLVGGVAWHLNNLFSVFYVSRVVSNSRIYGSLGLVPVFMIGLYVGWLILLFGAQVAYAFQNRAAYFQEKRIESINQRGREFIALRLMAHIGRRFQRGEPAATVPEMSAHLAVPTRLAQQIMQVLVAAHLVVEVAGGAETAYVPARPLESITCHDILLALRAGQGQFWATSEEPARTEVYGEFKRILEAERQAASAVTVLAMVNRMERQALPVAGEIKSVENAPDAIV